MIDLMLFAFLLSIAQCGRTTTCNKRTTLFDLTEDNIDQVIGGPHPVFLRMENEGCPYAATSNAIWREAASLFPNIIFARAECLYHKDICARFNGQVSPSHILFGNNSKSDQSLGSFTNPLEISQNSSYYVNFIYEHLRYYPTDSASIEELIPESTHLFFESYKYPVFILYNSSCFEDSDFLANWLIYATDEHVPSSDYGFGKIDCSKYPDECLNWGSTQPSANIFSSEKGISVSVTQTDNIDSRVSAAIQFLDQQTTVIQTPPPYATPLPSPVPVIENVRKITVDELQNRKVEDIRSEYNAAKQRSSNSDYDKTPDVYACNDITLKKEAINDCIRLFNFYRKLAGVKNQVTNDESLNNGCYIAAKYSSRSGKIDHKPNVYFKSFCDFETNWQTIGSVLSTSNLALGKTDLLSLVSQLIDDNGAGNDGVVGHRRTSLLPYLQSYGIGYYPLSTHSMETYSLQYPPVGVFQLKYGDTSQPLGINFIAWPPAGPFPIERLPSSFSIYYPGFDAAGINASNIIVKLTRDDGTILECSRVDFSASTQKMMNAVVFKLTDKSKALITAGHSLHVQVYLLKDSVRDCLDYTIDFFDDADEEHICFYKSDKSKCPSTVTDSHKYGPGAYSSHQGSGKSRTIVYAVEDITVTNPITLDYSKHIIVKGNKISGTVKVASTSEVDFSNPTSTDFEIQVNPGSTYQIGIVRVPTKPKSISLAFTQDPTTDQRVRSLVYFGPYCDIRFNRRITNSDFYFYYSISYDGLDAYLICTPVTFVQYALSGLDRNDYSRYINSTTGLATAYVFNDYTPLAKLTTNKKKIKIYYNDAYDQVISAENLPDYYDIDYEIYQNGTSRLTPPVTFKYSPSLSKKAKTLSLYSYSGGNVKLTFESSDYFPLSYYCDDFKVYDFKNMYISDLSSTYKPTYAIPDLLGNDASKEKFKLNIPTHDERKETFTNGNIVASESTKGLYITNGNYDVYTFKYTFSYYPSPLYILSPSPESRSKPVKIIYSPQQYNSFNRFYFKDYKDLTIQCENENYLDRIQLNNVEKVKFVKPDGTPFSNHNGNFDFMGTNIDFSSNGSPIAFNDVCVYASGEIIGGQSTIITSRFHESSPTLKGWTIQNVIAYFDSTPKFVDTQINAAELYIHPYGKIVPKILLKNSSLASLKLKQQEEYPYAKLLASVKLTSPVLIVASSDSKVIESLLTKSLNEVSGSKLIASKDKKGIYLVKSDFDESQAPESIPADIELLVSDEHFEINPTPPPPKPNQTPYPDSDISSDYQSTTDGDDGPDSNGDDGPDSNGGGGRNLSAGAIAAIVIVILIVAFGAVAAFFIIRYKKKQSNASDNQNENQETRLGDNDIEKQADQLEI